MNYKDLNYKDLEIGDLYCVEFHDFRVDGEFISRLLEIDNTRSPSGVDNYTWATFRFENGVLISNSGYIAVKFRNSLIDRTPEEHKDLDLTV